MADQFFLSITNNGLEKVSFYELLNNHLKTDLPNLSNDAPSDRVPSIFGPDVNNGYCNTS